MNRSAPLLSEDVDGLAFKLSYDLSDGLLTLSVPLGSGGAALRGEARPAELRGALLSEGRAVDAVGLGYAAPFGISTAALQSFKASGLTGWGYRPVRTSGWAGPTYYLLEILGRCGAVAFDQAAPLPAIGTFRRGKGAVVQPGAWDGADFAVPDNYDMVLCSERVRDSVDRGGLTGFRFEPLDEVVLFAPRDSRSQGET